jgi:hypothetical protein
MGFGRTTAVFFCLLAAGFIGCGGGPADLHAVTGTVTLDGAPIQKGSIGFEPVSDERTGGGAVIADGKFSIPQAHGLPVGKFRVVVHAAAPGSQSGAPSNALPGEAPPPPKELIPPEWNEASTHTIEVTKQGPYVFPIEIATKGK